MTPSAEERARKDADLYGIGFTVHYPNGNVEYIPKELVHIHVPVKSAEMEGNDNATDHLGVTISLAQLKVWQERARQDDACTYFVPSDIRQLIGEIFRLRIEVARLEKLTPSALTPEH